MVSSLFQLFYDSLPQTKPCSMIRANVILEPQRKWCLCVCVREAKRAERIKCILSRQTFFLWCVCACDLQQKEVCTQKGWGRILISLRHFFQAWISPFCKVKKKKKKKKTLDRQIRKQYFSIRFVLGAKKGNEAKWSSSAREEAIPISVIITEFNYLR